MPKLVSIKESISNVGIEAEFHSLIPYRRNAPSHAN